MTSAASELFELERELCRLFQTGEIDKVMDWLAPEAIVCPPGMDRIVGRENQRVMFKELAAMEGVELSWEPVDVYMGPSEDMGCVYGTVEWKLPGEEKQYGKYASVWVMTPDGWRNMVEIRNANA